MEQEFEYCKEVTLFGQCTSIENENFYKTISTIFNCNLTVNENNNVIRNHVTQKDFPTATINKANPQKNIILEIGDQAIIFHKDYIEIGLPFEQDYVELLAHYKETQLKDSEYYTNLFNSLKKLGVKEILVNIFEEIQLQPENKTNWNNVATILKSKKNHFSIEI